MSNGNCNDEWDHNGADGNDIEEEDGFYVSHHDHDQDEDDLLIGDNEDGGESNEAIREQCLTILSTRDAIMEPGVFDLLKRYSQCGGSPEEVVELLSENYVGLAQSANLLIQWLRVAGVSGDEINGIIEDYLKNVVKRHFDPRKADSIFEETGTTPTWLEEMIVRPTWRELFYELAEQYPNCLMMKFTIQLIADAGYQSEITSASTASQQIDVFSHILKTAVRKLFSDGEDGISSHLPEFAKMACHSQHTLLYSLSMLQNLAQSSVHAAKAKRVIEELQRIAPDKSAEAMSWIMHLSSVAAYPRVFGALTSMLSREVASAGDVTVLYKEYSSGDPPPVEFIQTPTIMNLLVDFLFKLKQVKPEHRHKYIYLLAYGASVYERWENGYRTALHREELHATQLALDRTQFTLQKATQSKSDVLSDLTDLYNNMRYPIVCLSVTCWCEATVKNPNILSVTTDSVPLELALLDEVSIRHCLLHSQVQKLLVDLLTVNLANMDVHQQLKLRRTVMDRLVHLFFCGHVQPVLSYIYHSLLSQSLDLSLIRHFVSEVLEMIREPFSNDIISLLLPIVENEDLVEPLKTSPQTSLTLTRFLRICSKSQKS